MGNTQKQRSRNNTGQVSLEAECLSVCFRPFRASSSSHIPVHPQIPYKQVQENAWVDRRESKASREIEKNLKRNRPKKRKERGRLQTEHRKQGALVFTTGTLESWNSNQKERGLVFCICRSGSYTIGMFTNV
jgi:hypothetical protein